MLEPVERSGIEEQAPSTRPVTGREWWTRFLRALAQRGNELPCGRRGIPDCGWCTGPRNDAERASCDGPG